MRKELKQNFQNQHQLQRTRYISHETQNETGMKSETQLQSDDESETSSQHMSIFQIGEKIDRNQIEENSEKNKNIYCFSFNICENNKY